MAPRPARVLTPAIQLAKSAIGASAPSASSKAASFLSTPRGWRRTSSGRHAKAARLALRALAIAARRREMTELHGRPLGGGAREHGDIGRGRFFGVERCRVRREPLSSLSRRVSFADANRCPRSARRCPRRPQRCSSGNRSPPLQRQAPGRRPESVEEDAGSTTQARVRTRVIAGATRRRSNQTRSALYCHQPEPEHHV